MKVPDITLQYVKCAKCECYLSRGPVYMQPYGVTVCGKCYVPQRPGARIVCYEALAKLLTFPCKNVKLGCKDTVPFVTNKRLIPHEEICPFRRFKCVLFGNKCNWTGIAAHILQHCLQKHKNKVFENPIQLEYDISNYNYTIYLIRAFQELFLLFIKISVTDNKIYQNLRYMGSSRHIKRYEYIFSIKRQNEQITRVGEVEAQGCLDINKNTALIIDIKDILNFFGTIQGCTVTIAVQHSTRPLRDTCVSCGQELLTLYFREDNGWCCKSCSPPKVICENRDCYYEDFPKKCEKHSLHYCNERYSCQICCKKLLNGSWFVHYHSAHRNITYKSGSIWRVNNGAGRYCLLKTVAGTAVCWYKLLDTLFVLYIYIPTPGERLFQFKCEVIVIQPDTKYSRTYNPVVNFKKPCDWFIRITKTSFATWKKELDVSVKIIKKNNSS